MTLPSRLRAALGLSALALVLAPVIACKEPTGPEREISGERLFLQNCARCHGVDGKGAPDAPPGTRDLTQAGVMSTLTDERIKATIRMGKPPNMPGFGQRFAEPSLKVLVAYVRGLAAPAPSGDAR